MNEIKHPDHLKSCRICLEKFKKKEKQIFLSNIIIKQFLEFTNIEVGLNFISIHNCKIKNKNKNKRINISFNMFVYHKNIHVVVSMNLQN